MNTAICLTEAITRLLMNQVPGTSIGKVEVFMCNQTAYKNHLYKVTIDPLIARHENVLAIKVVETCGDNIESLHYFKTPSQAAEYLYETLRSTLWTFEG